MTLHVGTESRVYRNLHTGNLGRAGGWSDTGRLST